MYQKAYASIIYLHTLYKNTIYYYYYILYLGFHFYWPARNTSYCAGRQIYRLSSLIQYLFLGEIIIGLFKSLILLFLINYAYFGKKKNKTNNRHCVAYILSCPLNSCVCLAEQRTRRQAASINIEMVLWRVVRYLLLLHWTYALYIFIDLYRYILGHVKCLLKS